MAAGDLITDDWQVELPGDGSGYLIGTGQPVRIVSITGLEDLPDVRVADLPRPRAAGSFPLPQYPGDRVVTIDVEVARTASASMRDVVDAFLAGTPLTTDEAPIVWRLPGSGLRRIDGRIRRREFPHDRTFGYGKASGAIQIVATDPRIVDAAQRSAVTGIGAVTGGLEFPHGFPHGFGLATAGTIVAANDGNTAAAWSATLTGPLTSPRVTVVGGPGDLNLSGFTLPAGSTLELDSRDRTVLLNGTASRYGSLTAREWFELPPGETTVQLGAAAGSGTLTLRWRSAWL